MDLLPNQEEFGSSIRLVVSVLTKLLLSDVLISIIVFLLFSSPDFNNFISLTNIKKFISTTAAVIALTGFIVLILFAFTSQRTTSTAIMTSQWGKSSKGPSDYSNEIISRQMRDWPTLMAGFICVFLGLVIMGFTR